MLKRIMIILLCCLVPGPALMLAAEPTATPVPVTGPATAPPVLYDLQLNTDKIPLDSKEAFVAWRLKQHPEEEESMITWRWDTAVVAIKRGNLTKQRIIEAFLKTPREYFVEKKNIKRAYEDNWLFIAHGVTISGPHLVSKMTDELDPERNHKVLEIGTGSGYQSAVLAQLSNYVYTIEIIEPRANDTDAVYKSKETTYPEYKNVHRKIGDGYYGWEEYAPFDRIIVTCGIDHIPPPLLNQLNPEGIMLIPVGAWGNQTLLKVTKHVDKDGNVTYSREDIYKGKRKLDFIPFTADGGKGKHSIERDKPQQ